MWQAHNEREGEGGERDKGKREGSPLPSLPNPPFPISYVFRRLLLTATQASEINATWAHLLSSCLSFFCALHDGRFFIPRTHGKVSFEKIVFVSTQPRTQLQPL